MTWYRCDLCKIYIEAVKCANNNSTARVFIHEDDLPGAKSWFVFLSDDIDVAADRNCWSIDPNDAKVCLPEGDDIYVFVSGFDYTNCSDCENDIGVDDGRGGGAGGGGGDGGGGGGGGGAGGGDGNLPPGVDPSGIKVTVCDGHVARAQALGWDTDNLYVPRAEEFAEAFISLTASICVSVPTGPVVNNPANAYWIPTGAEFDVCADCTDGYEATLCADDQALEGAADAPEIWIRKGNYDAAITGFAYGSFCYEIGALNRIPEDVFILNPTVDDPCSTCNRGVKYVLCDGETSDEEYYADGDSIDDLLAEDPTLSVITMRIYGVCHTLDLNASRVKIPPDSNIIEPRCEFVDCLACLCNGALLCPSGDNLGVPVKLCAHEDPRGWRPTYVKDSDLPALLTYFIHRGYCVWVDPNDTPVEIPEGADTVKVKFTFKNCIECLWGRPPNPNPPPLPPFPPLPIPPENFYELEDCDTGAKTGWWLREDFICGRFGIVPCDIRNGVFTVLPLGIGPEGCYKAVPPAALDKPPGIVADRWVTFGMFADCEACDPPPTSIPPSSIPFAMAGYDEDGYPVPTPEPDTWQPLSVKERERLSLHKDTKATKPRKSGDCNCSRAKRNKNNK